MTLAGYLVAWIFCVALALGALVFLLIAHAMDARWPIAYRRPTEDLAALLPLLALGFVPIALAKDHIYPAAPAHLATYLSRPFLVGRAVAYFAVWSVAALRLRKIGGTRAATARAFAAGMLPPVGITICLASFDWLLALTPRWHSTMYGFYFFAGAFAGAVGLIAALAPRAATPSHHGAIGRLLLAFTIFWAYTGYFQYMLVWIGSKPDETFYFDVARRRAGWVLAAARFAVPFLLLLVHDWKRRRAFIIAVGAWCAAGEYLDCCWLVGRWAPLELVWLVVVGGICAAAIAWWARRAELPEDDERLPAALAYRSD